ncbi:MAG: LysR substrate-binding domain-containing protein [Myxococcales bacterium]
MTYAPHPFSLRQLQYIVAVAEELSFRRAASRCNVSQPSLSAQLAQVEDALGVQLFERTQKRVLITRVGQELVQRARAVLREADEIVSMARRSSDPLSGTLRVGIIPTISPYLLPGVAPRLRSRLPRLHIAWREEKTDRLMSELSDGQIDAAVVALEANVGDVVKDVVATDPFFVVTLPEHPLAKKKAPLREADLRDYDLLLLDDGHCFRDQALEACSYASVRENEFRATSLTTLVQMVSGGAGITLIPALAVPAEAKRARLHARPLRSGSACRTIALVWRKGTSAEPALRALAAGLREAYPKAPV